MKLETIILLILTIGSFILAKYWDRVWLNWRKKENTRRGKTIVWAKHPYFTSSKNVPLDILGYVDESEDEDDLG